MAKSRVVNTKFWSDPWVMTKLNPLDRLLFLYLLTNEHTNISGIYEISEHKIAFDTGMERDTLVKAMLPRLEPKVYFKDNWVILVNFTKHQNLKSSDVVTGVKREFALAPIEVQEYALSRGWGEGLGIASGTKPNLTKPLGESGLSPLKYEIKPDLKGDGSEVKPRGKPKYPNARVAFSWFPRREKSWDINTTELKHGELLFLRGEEQVKKALEFVSDHTDEDFFYAVRKPSDLERKWNDILAFKKKHGL